MVFVANFYGLLVALVAIFTPLLAGFLFEWKSEGAGRYAWPLMASLFIACDLPLRFLSWRRIKARAVVPTIITREGRTAPPRKPAMEVAEALFAPTSGGQYFYGFPAWLVGVLGFTLMILGYFS